MALADDTERIKETLRAVPGIAYVTEGWPKKEDKFPCVQVERAVILPADHRDDARYMTSLSYYVRLFTISAEERRQISSAIDDAMIGIGYALENGNDGSYNPNVRQCTLVYKQVFGG